MVDMDKIVSLSKRRGFIFQSSEGGRDVSGGARLTLADYRYSHTDREDFRWLSRR